MAKVFATIRIMPDSIEVNLKGLEQKVKTEITSYGGDVVKITTAPIAFGLNALDVEFFIDESKGALDPLEEKLKNIEGVANASATSVRRAVG